MLIVVLWLVETVGAPLLKEIATELVLPAVAVTTPHSAKSEEQTVIEDEPLVEPVLKVSTEPLILACMTFAFELLKISYEPLPPLMVIGRFCPLTTEALVWLSESWLAPACSTTAETLGQVVVLPTWQSVIVVEPAVFPETVI